MSLRCFFLFVNIIGTRHDSMRALNECCTSEVSEWDGEKILTIELIKEKNKMCIIFYYLYQKKWGEEVKREWRWFYRDELNQQFYNVYIMHMALLLLRSSQCTLHILNIVHSVCLSPISTNRDKKEHLRITWHRIEWTNTVEKNEYI
jgi:hypothetical protein